MFIMREKYKHRSLKRGGGMKRTFLMSFWDLEKKEVTIALPSGEVKISVPGDLLQLSEEWEKDRKHLLIFLEQEEIQDPKKVLNAFLEDVIQKAGEGWTVKYASGPLAEYTLRESKGPETVELENEEQTETINRKRKKAILRIQEDLQDLLLEPFLRELRLNQLYKLHEYGLVTTEEYNEILGRFLKTCQEG